MSGWGKSPIPSLPSFPSKPTPEAPKDSTPWMAWMHFHVGEPEVTGSKATAFDRMVFSHTSDHEVEKTGIMAAGCAATVCAALELSGYKSTHRADAKSYLTYGTACELKRGCVVVFRWDDGSYHVTFCDEVKDSATVDCLGGNQSRRLQISTYRQSYIVAMRWPIQA